MKVAVALILMTAIASADPRADLASPDPKLRAAAAAELATTYRAVPRERWEPTVATLAKGDSERTVIAKLGHATPEAGVSGGGMTHQTFRLDDAFVVEAAFDDRTTSLVLREWKLVERLANVWVAPPATFTGTWTTYYASGARHSEIHYKGGVYFGKFTTFYPNGTRWVEQTYDATGITGTETGWYPSGKVRYRGQYAGGDMTGTWTWYDEAGKVTSTKKAHP